MHHMKAWGARQGCRPYTVGSMMVKISEISEISRAVAPRHNTRLLMSSCGLYMVATIDGNVTHAGGLNESCNTVRAPRYWLA